MRLQVAKALVGDPAPGDMLDVLLEDNVSFSLVYKPHELWLDYIWFSAGDHLKLRDVRVELQKMASHGIEREWMTAYADHNHPLAIGSPLHLTLAPNGNMSSWPRIQTRSAIKSIVVQ